MVYFEDVSIVEFWDNNYKLKIKKNSLRVEKNMINGFSIGFLFGFFEDMKIPCNLSEYSICQTSLEQIFNRFASEADEEVLLESAKKEIKITNELLSFHNFITNNNQ